MARLDAGDASLVVEGGAEGEGETQLSEGRVIGVRAPPDCLPRYELQYKSVIARTVGLEKISGISDSSPSHTAL